MRRFKVYLTRDTSESASIVVEAEDEDAANVIAHSLESVPKLKWEEGDSASRPETYETEEVEPTEPLGSFLTEEGAAVAHARELLGLLEKCRGVLLDPPHAGQYALYLEIAELMLRVKQAQGKLLDVKPTHSHSIDSRATE